MITWDSLTKRSVARRDRDSQCKLTWKSYTLFKFVYCIHSKNLISTIWRLGNCIYIPCRGDYTIRYKKGPHVFHKISLSCDDHILARVIWKNFDIWNHLGNKRHCQHPSYGDTLSLDRLHNTRCHCRRSFPIIPARCRVSERSPALTTKRWSNFTQNSIVQYLSRNEFLTEYICDAYWNEC